MQFDDILKEIGEFGPYQKRICFLLCVPILFQAAIDIINSYRMFVPPHKCATVDMPDQSKWIPYNSSGELSPVNSAQYDYGECRVTITTDANATKSYPCSSWTYDKTVFTSTCISEFDLVCDRRVTSTYMKVFINAGYLAGSFLEGFLSDRLGRKRTLCCGMVLAMLAGVGAGFSPNIYILTALCFIQSMSSSFVYSASLILGVELVGPSKRCWPGVVINVFYSAGFIILSGIGYGFRDWKYIQISISLPFILSIVYLWVIPESPRWLISQGRYSEARVIIQTIAKYNHTEDKLRLHEVTEDDNDGEPQQYTICHLFSSRSIFMRCVVIWTSWITIYITYYGFSLNAANLSGEFYLNHLLAGVAEFPANAVAFFLLDRIGRKRLFVSGLVIGGLCLLMTGIVEQFWPNETVSISVAMVGKSALATCFTVIYVWSAELFPTAVRSTGVNMGNFCGELGYVLTPYIIDQALNTPDFGRTLPLYIFAGMALSGSLCALMLPDMTMKSLPETLKLSNERSSKTFKQEDDTESEPTKESLLE